MKRAILVLSLVAIAAVLIASAVIANLGAGAKAPNFTLPTLDGKSFTLQKQAGSVVVMDIWATWCPPCRAEIPYFVKMNKKFAGKAVKFVGVSIDQGKPEVSDFVKAQKINYMIALDPSAKTVGGLYKVQGVPATYIIDKKGIIRFVHAGFGGPEDMAKMEKEIQSLLK